MKKLLLTSAALAMLALPAIAADMAPAPVPVYKAPIPVAVCTWCGFYAGVNAGGGWSSDSVNVSASPIFANPLTPATGIAEAAAVAGANGSFSPKGSGFIGGGQVGYNWQFGTWVAGFETDIQGSTIKGSSALATSVALGAPFGANSAQTSATVSDKLDYLGTVRGRLGYTVMPNVLVYGTGGLAYGAASSTTSITQQLVGPGTGTVNAPYSSSASTSSTRVGWTAGAGLEWMFMPSWSVKVEYLHYDLGSASYNNTLTNIVVPPGGGVPAGSPFYSLGARSSASFAGDIVRAGLNVKF
jgi:outer membrane immunogenic protein